MRARHVTRCTIAALTLSLALWGCGSKKTDKATKEQPGEGVANGTVSAVLSLGTKSKAKSGVQTKIKGKQDWQALKVGQSLTIGSALRAAKGTRVRVLLSDGTTLLLAGRYTIPLLLILLNVGADVAEGGCLRRGSSHPAVCKRGQLH